MMGTAISSETIEPAVAVIMPTTERDDTVEISDVWRVIWNRRFWIAGLTVAMLAAALLYSLLTPPLYFASGQILLDPRERVVVTNDVNPAGLSPDGGVTQVESQAKVVQSSSVLLRAIEKLDLTRDEEFGADASGLAARIKLVLGHLGISSPERNEADRTTTTLNKLRRQLAVKRADKVFVIDVGMTAKSPERAAEIVNAILEAYLDDQAQAKAEGALRASDALSGRLDQQRRKVREAEDAVETYKARFGIIEANNLLVTDQTFSSLTSELNTAQTRTALLRTRLALARSGGTGASEDATAEAMKSSTISQLRNQEALLVQSASQLRREFGPRYPALRNVELQLADLRRLIAEELDRVQRANESDYDRALAYERSLAAKLEQLKSAKVASDKTFVGLRELERELEAARTVYASYLLRAQEVREQAGIDSTNARVISFATPPIEKSWPPTPILLIAALGTALGLGAGGALAAEYVTPTIISPVQMRRTANAPDIGTVPIDEERRSLFSFLRPRRRPGHVTEMAVSRALLRLLASGPPADRTIRGRSILVTSGAGETSARATILRLLTAAALLRGRRVLFVDSDPSGYSDARPSGLFDVLRGRASLAGTIVDQPATGVSLIGRGNDEGIGPGETANAARLFLDEACKRFDFVVIDGCVIADDVRMLLIAPAVDDIVFLARLGRTRRVDVSTAADVLGTVGARITSTMLLKPIGKG